MEPIVPLEKTVQQTKLIDKLPISDQYKLIWNKIAPEKLITMLEMYIRSEFLDKNIFQKSPLMPIDPIDYTLHYNQATNKLTLSLIFKLDIPKILHP